MPSATPADLVDDARQFLDPRIVRTPVVYSPALSDRLGVPVHLKLECFQVTGSFKVRGAWFALHRLGRSGQSGVCTCSAGNHGLGLAFAARRSGIPVVVYVPDSVDEAKLASMRRLGALVVRSPYSGFDDTEAWARVEAGHHGHPYVSAYDDVSIIAGNGGSIGSEILDQVPAVTSLVAPVGGGGLAAGLSIPFGRAVPAGRLIAVQIAASPSLVRSLERGEAVPRMPPVETLAGGLEGGLGTIAFSYLKSAVDQVALVSESELREAVRWSLRELRLLVEPSSAVAIAACLSGAVRPDGPTVVVVTGRNVSRSTLRMLLHGPVPADATD